MKKKSLIILMTSLVSLGTLPILGTISFAMFEKSESILYNDSGAKIPIVTSAARNTAVYVVPTAWTSYLSGNDSVDNCYIVACMYKSDDSRYEFQGIRTCSYDKTKLTANITSIDIHTTGDSPDLRDSYKFSMDLTYYDRISFHRFGYTSYLGDYIGGLTANEGPDTFVSKSTDATHIPLDWRNRDTSSSYRRYDATHRQVKPTEGYNVFKITSLDSGGSYGFLAWGNWISNLII